jgi:hypothetical protein
MKKLLALVSLIAQLNRPKFYQYELMWFKRDKEKERFYLLPGQGGRAMRRKRAMFLAWSIAAGLIVSLGMAFALYFANMRH